MCVPLFHTGRFSAEQLATVLWALATIGQQQESAADEEEEKESAENPITVVQRSSSSGWLEALCGSLEAELPVCVLDGARQSLQKPYYPLFIVDVARPSLTKNRLRSVCSLESNVC